MSQNEKTSDVIADSAGVVPVLPLRDVVVYPHMVIPLFVGREKSIKALDTAMQHNKQILLVAQKSAGQDDPGTDDIYRVGTVSSVLQLLKLPDGTVKVLVEGNARAEIHSFIDNPRFFQAHAGLLPETDSDPGTGPANCSQASFAKTMMPMMADVGTFPRPGP